MSKDVRNELNELVASVEIVNQKGELERVYFAYPRYCLNLTEESRNDLFDRMDPNDPTRQT